MLKSILKIFIASVIVFSLTSFAQTQRQTKGADNGYAWHAMESPHLLPGNSKHNYLSGILERYAILKENYPESVRLGCSEEINQLLQSGRSADISLDDMVNAIDKFYRNNQNMIISIIFAYCYCIKEKAGVSKKDLAVYRAELLLFSAEEIKN
jgi:hypothetical protein